ncbi:P-loop containing nucleoside triphosphate hydrolase protein [Rostrohypoxylon terebratum]|nr:P-loop containing nucleoside triphosphate hydrolase protein [Rostrohypoxylon terebratum]
MNIPSPKSKLAQFFQEAHKLVQGTTDISQCVVTELATEEAAAIIRVLLDDHVRFCGNNHERINLWRDCVRPLFGILTEPRVINSAILEVPTGTIYNVILGYDGTRVHILFMFLIGLAEKWQAPLVNVEDGSKDEFLGLCISVLVKAVDCGTRKTLTDVVPKLVIKLQNLVDGLDRNYWSLQAVKHLEYIRRHFNIAEEVAKDAVPSIPLPDHATFFLPPDLPGSLSADGPRHDNDFEDISKIRILPTMSELISTRQDYRPVNNPSHLHLPGIQGLIDRHFRLLREDTVGQLKQGIFEELQILQNPKSTYSLQKSASKFSYGVESVVHATCTRRLGLEFHLKLKQPEPACKMTTEARENWWRLSKRLEAGALVCLLERDTAVFCVVSESTIRPKNNLLRKSTQENRNRVTTEKQNLYINASFAYVSLSLAEPSDADLGVMLRAIRFEKPTQRSLVEFPGVLLPSFKPTLSALQQISKTLDLPFTNLLAPISDGLTQVTIPPPLYTTKPKFAFDLKCLTSDGGNFTFRPKNSPNPRDLSSRSSLDEGQALALLNTLKRSLALIQGPPGTGKSYTGEAIIKVLLANKKNADIGPIICICRTNHALDQLLENIWHGGVKQIIRIGSRSKSAILKEVNLRKVAQDVERTRSEKRALSKSGPALEKAEKALKSFIDNNGSSTIPKRVKDHIKSTATAYYKAIFGTEHEEWSVSTSVDEDNCFRRWVNEGIVSDNTSREISILMTLHPSALTRQERILVCSTWASEVIPELEEEFIYLHREHWNAKRKHETVQHEMDLRILRHADVIGATTTGLAKNLETLRRLDSKVILCEEAGEVLESHILTALLPSVEQAILIGDHLQLRPHIDNWELSVANPQGEKYSLDVSLFERLVKPTRPTDLKLPFDMLTVQRRMHPSISNLIRNTLYHNLQDSKGVGNYPEVTGMRKRLYWFDHEYPETSPNSKLDTDTSRANNFEVEMVCAFVSHLVRQGVYNHDDIAIITPYLGQLHKLRFKLEESFEVVIEDQDLIDLKDKGFDETPIVRKQNLGSCLRLATVDNFQGEEAKVVAISLVRSNLDQQCGFMANTNRINVLLSRAKHGMYIFGNSTTYGAVGMWSKVIHMLNENGNIGTSLPLQCPRHKDTLIEVSDFKDFAQLSPDGGCNAQCLQALECGHKCFSVCHAAQLHMTVKCQQQCSLFKKACNHSCPNRCGDPCEEKCSTILEGQELPLPCGHVLVAPQCWQTLEPGQVKCRQRTKITIPGCNHSAEVLCRGSITNNPVMCTASCDYLLMCGHKCPGTCETCIIREDGRVVKEAHRSCASICGRHYDTCSHICKRPCHPDKECPPCDVLCDEQCIPCKKSKCSSKCPHGRCTMPCAAPCNWIPCFRRCTEQLQPCGHQCPSLCGEVCPDAKYCQICATDDISSTIVDTTRNREYRHINLDMDPCIFPRCGHMMTVSSMDSQLGMAIAIKGIYKPLSSTNTKVCPKCRGSLRNISRYGRLVRQALLDESTRRFICWYQTQFNMLEQRLIDEQQKLESQKNAGKHLKLYNRAKQYDMGAFQIDHLTAIQKYVSNGRYNRMISLYFDIFLCMDHIRDEEKPYKRVFGLIDHVHRTEGIGGSSKPSASQVHTRGELLAQTTLFRCYLIVLSDFLALRRDSPECRAILHFRLERPLEDCEMIIKLAQTTGYIVQEAEGHIFFTRLVALVKQLARSEEPIDLKVVGLSDAVVIKAKDHYLKAEAIANKFPSASHLQTELDAVGKMLSGELFYGGKSVQEQHVIHTEMATKLISKGQWYTCAHGHPFTVAGSPLSMGIIDCPECGAHARVIES